MRLIYITSTLPHGATAEAFLLPEIAELRRRGHEVLVVPMCPRGPVANEDARTLLPYCASAPLHAPSVLAGACRQGFGAPRTASGALDGLVTGHAPRHALKNLAVYPKGLWLARLALAWGADHLFAHWAAATSTLALVASRASGIPWSFTAHQWDIYDNNALALKLREASFARFISNDGVAILSELGLEAPAGKVCVVPMGVSLPAAIAPPEAFGERTPIALVPARLVYEKGHEVLLNALMHLKAKRVPLQVWLAGDGPERETLEAIVDRLDLREHVRFLGWVSHDALLTHYARGEVDMVVLPSLDEGGTSREGIPVSLMEAMGHGLPVVSTRSGGTPELVTEGSGLLVEPGDVDALTNALLGLARDAERRRQLGAAGRERIEAGFSIERVVSELEARFAKALVPRALPRSAHPFAPAPRPLGAEGPAAP